MKLPQLTFTRFFAALSIVVYHVGINYPPFNGGGLMTDFFKRSFVFVNYFFMLSGFVMVIAYAQKGYQKINFADYYIKRFARIYPIYFIALLLTILPILPHPNLPNFLLQSFLIQSWFPGHPLKLNFPGWSLSAEAFFYLIFPVIFSFFYAKVKPAITAILVVTWFIGGIVLKYHLLQSSFYHGFPSKSHDLINYFPLMCVGDFLLGNLIGIWFLRIPKKFFKNYDVVLLLIAALIVFLVSTRISVAYLQLLLLPLAFGLFILFLSLNKSGWITRILSVKALVILGEASFGVYILQVPVFRLLGLGMRFGGISIEPVLGFYIKTVLLIGISVLSYFYIEIPLRTWIINQYNNRVRVKHTLKN